MQSSDRPRTVAIDGRMIFQEQCHGIARVTIELIRNMPDDMAGDIFLILAEGRSTRFDLTGLPAHVEVRQTSSVVARPHDLRDLWRVLREINAGVLYAPYHALAPLYVPCPLVVGVHDCILESDRRLAGTWARRVAYKTNTERALRQAVAVVVPSESTRALLPAFYRHVPPATICPNGVDASFGDVSELDKVAARATLGLPDTFVLHVGARRLHKNQEVLLRALTQMPQDVGLVLVGSRDPHTTDSLDQLATELGVADRTLFVEEVSDAVLRGIYGCATVFAYPSTAEGFGLPPLEAMSAGIPVVASAIPAVAEVCRGAAVLVSPFSPDHWAQALSTVLASAALRAELRDKGRRVASAASWERGAHRLYELLSGIAAGTRDVGEPDGSPAAESLMAT